MRDERGSMRIGCALLCVSAAGSLPSACGGAPGRGGAVFGGGGGLRAVFRRG